MVRGNTLFTCSECGKKFKALDIEYAMTCYSEPQPCPKCGGYHTRPFFDILSIPVYRKIWEERDKSNNG